MSEDKEYQDQIENRIIEAKKRGYVLWMEMPYSEDAFVAYAMKKGKPLSKLQTESHPTPEEALEEVLGMLEITRP